MKTTVPRTIHDRVSDWIDVLDFEKDVIPLMETLGSPVRMEEWLDDDYPDNIDIELASCCDLLTAALEPNSMLNSDPNSIISELHRKLRGRRAEIEVLTETCREQKEKLEEWELRSRGFP